MRVHALLMTILAACGGERAAPPVRVAEPTTLVALIQGSERFMGNLSTVDPTGQPMEPMPGAYEQVREALGELAKAGPPGAQGAVLTYGQEVTVRSPLGPLVDIKGEVIGPAAGYVGVGAKRLEQGLGQALDLLEKTGGRRILVVIGDCGDINANATLDAALARAKALGVEVYVLRATARRDDLDRPEDAERMRKLSALGAGFLAASLDDIRPLTQDLVRRINAAAPQSIPQGGR